MKTVHTIVWILCCFLSAGPCALASVPLGIMFGSYGDIDDVQTELRPYIRNTLTDPDVLPLPSWLRATIADVGWYIERRQMRDSYSKIGGKTGMRAISQAQAEAVAQALRRRGYEARGYAGFTMTFPYVAETLAKAQADGVERLIVIYQGAQYSRDTTHILFRHVRDYLAQHPEWKVTAIGINSFADDKRFVDIVAQKIERGLSMLGTEFIPDEACLFLSIHGNVERLRQDGDPYMDQVMRVVDQIRERFHEVTVGYGFHNHDEIPGVAWSQPSTDKSLGVLARKECKAVLINGDVSFTVDNLETLYNQKVEHPERLLRETQAHRLPPKKVVVQDIFNVDPLFIDFMASIAEEANFGGGDLVRLDNDQRDPKN